MAQTQSDVSSSTTGEASGGSVADQAKQQAQQVSEQAREKAVQAKDQVQSKVRTQLNERTTQAGEKLSTTLQDVRTVGQQLREQGQDTPARLADQVAEKGDRVAGYLQSADADQLLSDVEDFARRNPWAVAAGGLVIGLAASRFLKASSEQRSSERRALPRGYGSGLPASPASSGTGGS